MKFSVDFIDSVIVIKANPDGQFVSFKRLKEHVLHLASLYKVNAVKVNSISGLEVCVKSQSDDDILSLIDFPEPRKCPECSTVMEDGTCYTQSTLTGFLAFGWSYKNLFFKARHGKPKVIVHNGEQKSSFHCQSCGLTLIH